MTSNQIAYNALQENSRHNIATESENYRHNTVGEAETMRSNYERESQGRQQLTINAQAVAEQGRHNLQTELLGRDTLAEDTRHTR